MIAVTTNLYKVLQIDIYRFDKQIPVLVDTGNEETVSNQKDKLSINWLDMNHLLDSVPVLKPRDDDDISFVKLL